MSDLRPAYQDDAVTVYHCGHAELAAHLAGTKVDALIVDAPYSERTHGAYREMAEVGRQAIGYAAWTADDVTAFVAAWSGLVRGWVVSLTDHVLMREWETALAASFRYVFAPLACMEPGSRVRLSGDGPCQWSVQAVVARPRSREFAAWGALPGGYVVPHSEGWRGQDGRGGWMGGKPVWLIRALVRDYSRPGDLIVDPCCGAGTLGVAVRYEGRRAILADKDPAAVECTIKRLRGERTKAVRDDFPESPSQPSLFGRTA